MFGHIYASEDQVGNNEDHADKQGYIEDIVLYERMQ